MNGAPWFIKYVGIQGIVALLLYGGFVFATLQQIPLPDNYTELMLLVTGFYFGKNGVGIISAIKG